MERTDRFDHDMTTGILDDPTPPCLSLMQPTHRRVTENDQDPIRFRNLVKELEAGLLERLPKAEVQALLEPFHDLAADSVRAGKNPEPHCHSVVFFNRDRIGN